MPKPNTFIDGSGVFDDIPLKGNPRIRFRPTDNPKEDITVAAEDGHLVIRGVFNQLVILPGDSSSILVRTEDPS